MAAVAAVAVAIEHFLVGGQGEGWGGDVATCW